METVTAIESAKVIDCLKELFVDDGDIEKGIYDKEEADVINQSLEHAIESVEKQSEPVLDKFKAVVEELRADILLTIHNLTGDDPDKVIRFKSPVYLHFIDDNTFTDCRQVDFNGNCKYVRVTDQVHDDFDTTFHELDISALHELFYALNEKDFSVEQMS